MPRLLQILALVLFSLSLTASAQTFTEGDYQLNRKKATAGFEVAELLAGSNITFTWNNTNKTLTLAGSAGTGGTSITTLGTITTGTWQATAIADTYIASAATWNAKQAALVSGTNLKTVNGTSLLGSGNLAVGNITDGQTLTTGLTFPYSALWIQDEDDPFKSVFELTGSNTGDRPFVVNLNDAQRYLDLSGDLTVSANATISGTNTGDQDLTNYVQTGDSPTFNQITLTNGLLKSPTGIITYDFDDIVDSTAVPYMAVRLFDDQGTPSLIGFSLFGFRGDGAGSGTQIFQGSTDSFAFEGVLGANTATVSAATFSGSFTGSGANLTNIDAGDIATGTLATARLPTVPVANGGTGATTLTANAVLLGNGTSALQAVAPSTSGNVLTSNGTTWTSAAPTTGANPAGSGSELQFRSTGTTFGALTSSSVSGSNLTLGGLLTVTPAAANTGYLAGTGYSLTGSDTTAMLNLAGTWNTTGIANGIKLDVTDTASNANSYLMHLTVGGANRIRIFKNGDIFTSGNLNGTILTASNYLSAGDSGQFILGASLDTRLQRDAAAVWAMRNGANAHTLRIYEVDSGANDEYLELSAASGTNLIRPQATGTGTASVVRYHTTTAVFWTSGSGSPESVVTAPVGSLYTRTDGGASTTLYVKESGTGSTGWIAK